MMLDHVKLRKYPGSPQMTSDNPKINHSYDPTFEKKLKRKKESYLKMQTSMRYYYSPLLRQPSLKSSLLKQKIAEMNQL